MPTDQWDYLPHDDDIGEPEESAPEESALHYDEEVPTPAEDPGRAEVDLAEHTDAESSITYFTDEEPEPASGNHQGSSSGEHTEDLEEILEVQHYAFAEDHGEAEVL